MENSSFLKAMFLVLVVLYVVSPVDAVPGPVDDVIVILLSYAANKN